MSFQSPAKENRKNWVVLSLVAVCAIVTLLIPRTLGTAAKTSPVSGLMVQTSLARQAMPYEVALANGKPTLVEFYADWCTTCQAFAPTLQRLHEQWGDQVNFVMLDIDDPQWRSQIQQFQATGVPHLTLLDTDHTPVETWIGNVPPSILLNETESLLS